MWALQLVAPHQFERRTLPSPDPASLRPGEVLVQTILGGICGSDLRGFRSAVQLDGTAPAPGFPMHELVGEVIATTDPGLAEGDTVVGWASASNGLAELVVTAGDGLARVEDHVAPEVALLAQPLACVLSALDRVGPVAGTRAAVIGMGPMGLLFAHILKARGAAHVTGIDPVARIEHPESFGVDEMLVMPAERWAEGIAPGSGPDVVLEAVGHQRGTLDAAIKGVGTYGRLYYFGIPHPGTYELDMTRLLRQQLTLMAGTTARRRRHHLTTALGRLDTHRQPLAELVTDVVDIADAAAAYELAARPAPGHVKVLVRHTR